MRVRVFLGALSLMSLYPSFGRAQQASNPPVVDSIAVITHNVFRSEEASSNLLFRLANGVRFRTRSSVVWREILFDQGAPYDSATVAETERNLRRLRIFRRVEIDSVRVDGRLVVVVETDDAWSTQFQFNLRSTGSVLTGSVALSEENFLGGGNQASVGYRDEPDRTAVTFRTQMRRVGGSRFTGGVLYDDLSDGFIVSWNAGVPFQSLTHREAVVLTGTNQQRRILHFRDGLVADSLQKRTFQNNLSAAIATTATSRGYVRLGLQAQVRREEYVAFQDTGLVVPDTVTGAVGAYVDVVRPRFAVVTHYNGFDREEDVNLSTRFLFTAWVAPTAFGYRENGIGPTAFVSTGAVMGDFFARLSVRANGLFTASSLDSGQVFGSATIASKVLDRHATVLHVEAGARKGQPPGQDFDLGHGVGPRSFEPHAFTGNRMIWGILEHRWFAVDEVLGLFGVGVAGFLDYGGAWFNDEPARLGGNVGLGLRIGNSRSSATNTGRFDLAYRYGEGFEDKRWVFSFGRAFVF